MSNQLYIWKLENLEYSHDSYDVYDSCVVVSESEEKAKRINPSTSYYWDDEDEKWYWISIDNTKTKQEMNFNSWANHINYVKVMKIGIADSSLCEGDIVCESLMLDSYVERF